MGLVSHYGQRYSAEVRLGLSFRSTVEPRVINKITVTSLTDGGFVVTRMSQDQDASGWGIYGQRYASDGSESARVSDQQPMGDQQYPMHRENGGFVVVWMSTTRMGPYWHLWAVYFPDGGAWFGFRSTPILR